MAIALLFGLLVGGFELFYLRALVYGHAALARNLADVQYRKAPGLRLALEHVRALTPKGARIAVIVAPMHWWQGYEYVYSRSSYTLAGRELVALVDPDDSRHLERLSAADYIFAWQASEPVAGFDAQWSDGPASLLRRAR